MKRKMINTRGRADPSLSPRAFLDYIINPSLDPSSVRDWERKTLSPYLDLESCGVTNPRRLSGKKLVAIHV